jgi:hypothetical protein
MTRSFSERGLLAYEEDQLEAMRRNNPGGGLLWRAAKFGIGGMLLGGMRVALMLCRTRAVLAAPGAQVGVYETLQLTMRAPMTAPGRADLMAIVRAVAWGWLPMTVAGLFASLLGSALLAPSSKLAGPTQLEDEGIDGEDRAAAVDDDDDDDDDDRAHGLVEGDGRRLATVEGTGASTRRLCGFSGFDPVRRVSTLAQVRVRS